MRIIFFVLLIVSPILDSRTYVYDMHFPQQDPPWYFWARSISDDKKGSICIEAGTEVFFLNQNGRINKNLPILADVYGNGFQKIGIDSISVDEEGNIYGRVFSIKDYIMVKADPSGKIIKWGEPYVMDLMYSNGYIYGIAPDYTKKEYCIVVWDKELNRVKQFGEYGDGPGKFRSIQGLWVANNKVYIGDTYIDKNIMIYDINGNFLNEFIFNGNSFGNLCSDNYGNIYLFGTALIPNIQKYSASGSYIKGWGNYGSEPGNFLGCKDINFINGKIYTSDYILGRVQIFDAEGNLLGIWSACGTEAGKFLWAQKIEVSNNEKIFIADTRNKRVQVFNKKGELEMIIGGEGRAYFLKPESIAVDDEGNIFVWDGDADKIYKFDKKGNLSTSWSTFVSPYYLNDIADIAVDKDGCVYALNGSSSNIVKFTNNGGFVKDILFNLDCSPFSFDLDNQKNILTPCGNIVKIFDQDGNKIKELRIGNQGDYSFLDIDISMQGNIILYDYWPENRVLVIDYDGNIIDIFGNDMDLIKGLRYGRSVSTAPDGSVYVLELWRVVRYKPRPGLAQTIPASASTQGVNNTYWRTDLSIFNPSDKSIDLKLNYFSNFGNKEIDLSLRSYGFLNLKDLISNEFGMPETFGAITSICLEEKQPVLFSRTYTEPLSASTVRDPLYNKTRARETGMCRGWACPSPLSVSIDRDMSIFDPPLAKGEGGRF